MTDAPTLSVRAQRRLLRALFGLPEPVLRALRGPTTTNDRGEPLDPQVQVMLRLQEVSPEGIAHLDRLTPAEGRRRMIDGVRIVEGPLRPLARVERRRAGDVPVRIYLPELAGAAPLPVLVYVHGGGWVTGDLDTHDRLCRRLAAEAAQAVVALDYPLAPERPYPAGLRGVVDAFGWVRERAASFGGDPQRVAIGGDSAGGNLSAAACLALRDAGRAQPAFQLLVYPGLDLRCLSRSYHLLGEGFMLTRASIQWYLRHYGADPTDPRASPLLEPDLGGLCPAIVATAGFDPLRDDGEQYAERLAAAGVEVDALAFPHLIHGFANMDGALGAADRALGRVIDAVRRRWAAGQGEDS